MFDWLSDFFSKVGAADSIRVTFVLAFWATLISSVLGVGLGLLLERLRFPGKRLIVRINRTMMGIPPVVVGLVTYMLLMRRGPLGSLGWLFSIKGMVLAQTIIITPVVTGLIHTAAVRNAPAIRTFARTMGASPAQTALLLVREMKNEVFFAILTGFGRSISEVGAVMLVGGNIKDRSRTMTTAISTLKSAGVFTDGITLGIILLIMAFIVQTAADMLRREDRHDENN